MSQGETFAELGRMERAAGALSGSHRMCAAVLGESDPRTIDAARRAAELLARRGR